MSQLRDNYIQHILDNADYDTMYSMLQDCLLDEYSKHTDDDIRDEIVDLYDEETLKQLDPPDTQKSLYDEVVEYYKEPNSYLNWWITTSTKKKPH